MKLKHWFFLIPFLLLGNFAFAQKSNKLKYPVIKNYGGIVDVKTSIVPKTVPKIIIDLTTGANQNDELNPALDRVARLLNLYGMAGIDLKKAEIAVVIHGSGTVAVLNDKTYSKEFGVENPNAELLSLLKKHNVKLMVCGQALKFKGYEESQVNSNIEVALSALTVVAEYDQQGFTLMQF